MKDKFQNFMYGRYGTDSLNKFLIYASFAFIVLNLFIRNNGVSFLVYAILIYAIFRMISRATDSSMGVAKTPGSNSFTEPIPSCSTKRSFPSRTFLSV